MSGHDGDADDVAGFLPPPPGAATAAARTAAGQGSLMGKRKREMGGVKKKWQVKEKEGLELNTRKNGIKKK